MSWEQFWFVLIGCVLAMWACRVIPLFLLKGRELPPRLAQALGFIPPAAFAALVANDLLNPGMFDAGLWPAAAPLVAALVRARSLESAVRKVKEGRDLRLPDGTYYIFEEGRYARGLQITLSPKNVILKNGGK